jgi:hypothetical protein
MPDYAPYWPIIYVRGYAMTEAEIDDTTADPFCGFNLGATVYRAKADKNEPPRKFVFESPVVRLASDFDYKDVFDDGMDIVDHGWEADMPVRAIVVYRYYEPASTLLGTGTTPPIEDFAKGLSDLILRVRDLVCGNSVNKLKAKDFRCYLVAHSMGGLVCRAFLQNPKLGTDEARACVDKFFTYATPHNGIEMAGMNIPSWLSANDMSNFNRTRMADYLNLKALFKKSDRVDWIPEDVLPSERVFCLIGTNRSDYETAKGLSRTFVGHGSDGLVRIENASLWGFDSASGKGTSPAARSYVYRSHSGFFGIVNSEESYQNLIRFLFGDVRVDIWLDITNVTLPPDVQKEADKGRGVNALYQIEVQASPRGKPWYLSRRMAEEDSVACRTHQELTSADPSQRSAYLSTVFLGNLWKVNPKRKTLAYRMMLGIRVPDYEIDRAFWFNQHYEGSYLFRDSLILEMVPPPDDADPNKHDWSVKFSWESDSINQATNPVDATALKGGKIEIPINFEGGNTPGIKGTLRFIISGWND